MKRLNLLDVAINIEDLAQQQEMTKFTLLYVKVEAEVEESPYNFMFRSFRNILKHFHVAKSRIPPNVMKYSLALIPMYKFKTAKEGDWIYADIVGCKKGAITFKEKLCYDSDGEVISNEINLRVKHVVRFVQNRITFQACSRAIQMVEEHKLESFFENFQISPFMVANVPQIHEDFEWFNSNIADNKEQKIAIANIVNCTAFPLPYIIFGPPGMLFFLTFFVIFLFF